MSSFVYQRKINLYEVDVHGLVHFSNFFRYMEECESAYFRSLGLSFFGSNSEWASPRIKVSCNFFQVAEYGEKLNIILYISRIGNSSIEYTFQIKRANTLIAQGSYITVCTIKDKETGSIKAIPIPDNIRSSLRVTATQSIDA